MFIAFLLAISCLVLLFAVICCHLLSRHEFTSFATIRNSFSPFYVRLKPSYRLATKPIVLAVQDFALSQLPNCKLLFGLDANTYAKPEKDQQGVEDFGNFYTNLKLNSCYGPHPNPQNFTTFHARTHLQPQLNKAISLEQKDVKGDKNPKDFILFFHADFTVLSTTKDNTGKKEYIENMVFPTLSFPSDHGITSTVVAEASTEKKFLKTRD